MGIRGLSITRVEQQLMLNLKRLDKSAAGHALRLSTLKKISSPSDDPSGYVQISGLEQRISLLTSLKTQVDSAATAAAESQLAVDQMRTQLDTIRAALVADEDGALTSEQRTAKQAEIDDALDEINRLSRTQTNGRRYLDGSSNYTFSGLSSSQVQHLQVHSLRGTQITGQVVTAATQAKVTYSGTGGSKINGNATFTLTGSRGSATFSVVDQEQLSAARDRINAESHITGVIASVGVGNKLDLTSVDYGDAARIAVTVSSGTFATTGTYAGTDAVVRVNGQTLSNSQVDGNRVSYNVNGTALTMDLVAGFVGNLNNITVSSNSTAQFMLSTDPQRLTRLGMPSLNVGSFQSTSGSLQSLMTGGSLSGLGSVTSQAIRVVDESLSRLSRVEAQLDAFANVAIASASSSLNGLLDELQEALEMRNAVDEAEEEAALSHTQTLTDHTVSVLAILQQQQSSISSLLRSLSQV